MARTPAAASPAGGRRSGCLEPAPQAALRPEPPSGCRKRTDRSSCRRPEAASAHCPVGRSGPAAAAWARQAAPRLEASEPLSACRRQTRDVEHRRRRAAAEHHPAGCSAQAAVQGRKAVPQAAGPLSAYHRPRTDEERRRWPAGPQPVPWVQPEQEAARLVAAAGQRDVRAAPDARQPAAHAAELLRVEQEAPDERAQYAAALRAARDERAEPHAARVLPAAPGAVAARRRARHGAPRDPVRVGRGVRDPSLGLPACPLLSRPAPSGWWRSRRGHRRRAPDTRPTVRGSTRWSSA